MTSEPVMLPGFGQPVNHRISYLVFPSAVIDWAGTSTTVRERAMIALMDSITDKPEWDRKVFDDGIVSNWRKEALDSDMDVSEKMLDWIMAELRDKAESYQIDGIVSTLDLDVAVVKSDTAISPELNERVRAAVKPLEDIPPKLKDWHPGSDEKVLDLVHPSLFPLVYGRSKVLPAGRIPLADCLNYIGKGETTKVPDESEIQTAPYSGFNDANPKLWSKNFQWLPCQVEFTNEDEVRITSYINNLHPAEYPSLYTAIESCIAKSIPLWNRTLSSIRDQREQRIEMDRTEYTFPEGEELPKSDDDDDDDESGYDRIVREDEWRRSTRVLVHPEPDEYEARDEPAGVNLKEQFRDSGLQVIVKLANIELTPQKPTYEGGAWHIEGQLNERICASALYYYDSENVTDSYLAFRQRVDDEIEMKAFDQDDYEGVEEIYGIEQDGPKVQEIGRIQTRPTRLLAFPNVLQHRVSPFRLANPSLPGHRKLLALFLVDPHSPIISTANVPPQQKEWLSRKLADDRALAMLPQELAEKVVGEVREGVMTGEEARVVRGRLMEERKAFGESVEGDFASESFSFCEH